MKTLLIPALWGDFNLGLERTLSAIADGLLHRGHSVDVAVRRPLDLERIKQTFAVELEGIRVRQTPDWSAPLKQIPMIGRKLAGLNARRGFRNLTAEYDLALIQSSHIPPASGATRSVLFTEFPRDPTPSSRDWRHRLNSYDLLIGNSEFTRQWIERYWSAPTEVFYPSIQECVPLAKKPWILGVGRFIAGGRSKGQLEMVETFRKMVDEGLDGWRLQLAGLAGTDGYLDRVRDRVQSYPIDIHVDATAAELAALYGSSSLFWHTTGLGADLDTEPQRFEHFGIVVAEAMTAGCVPLVFGEAGPKEIVADPQLCWSSLTELQYKATALIADSTQRQTLAVACRERAVEHFGHAAFDRSVDRLIA